MEGTRKSKDRQMEWKRAGAASEGMGYAHRAAGENTGVQTAVSDGGRVVAAQEALDPTIPRAGLTVAANPRQRNLSLVGVVGAWRGGAGAAHDPGG